MNKDVLAPNLKAHSLTALCLIHDSISVGQIEIADNIITDELLTSCSHASNRCKMYLMEKNKEDQEPEKIWKRKAVQEELVSAKKRKTELKVTAQNLVYSAHKELKKLRREQM